jgi:hypothetical protein
MLVAELVVLGHAAGAVVLGWLCLRRCKLDRPPVGVFGLADVGFVLGGILVVPLLYLALPLWATGWLLALGALSALNLLAEPLLPHRGPRWAALAGVGAAEFGAVLAPGRPGAALFLVNNVVTVLVAVAIANLWVQSGLRARDATILGAALAVYDYVATSRLSLMGDLLARVSELPFSPLLAWGITGPSAPARPSGPDGSWFGLGLGDVLLATVYPLVHRKAYGRGAGLAAVAFSLGTLVGLALLAHLVAIETFPVMLVLGPLMVLQYAWCAARRGPERTTRQYLEAEPVGLA